MITYYSKEDLFTFYQIVNWLKKGNFSLDIKGIRYDLNVDVLMTDWDHVVWRATLACDPEGAFESNVGVGTIICAPFKVEHIFDFAGEAYYSQGACEFRNCSIVVAHALSLDLMKVTTAQDKRLDIVEICTNFKEWAEKYEGKLIEKK